MQDPDAPPRSSFASDTGDSPTGVRSFGSTKVSRRENRQFSVQSNPNPDTEDLLP